MMSDFLSRLIQRSTGTAEVVHPMITSMYASDWHTNDRPSPEIDFHNEINKTEGKTDSIPSSSSEWSHVNNQNRKKESAEEDREYFHLREYSSARKPDRMMVDMPVREDQQEIYSQAKSKETSVRNKFTKENENHQVGQNSGQTSRLSNGRFSDETIMSSQLTKGYADRQDNRDDYPALREFSDETPMSKTDTRGIENHSEGQDSAGKASRLSYRGLSEETESDKSLFTNIESKKDTIKSMPLVQENPEYKKKGIHLELIHNQTGKRLAHKDNYDADFKSASTNPTIRITIGRIEVKAIMKQSAPPRRAIQQKPKLSLEDYLKQRTGGHR